MRSLWHEPLIRLFVVNGLLGVGFGLAIAAVLVAVDFRDVGTLAATQDNGFVAIVMLATGLAVTCGGAAIATAVMLLPWEDDDASGGGSGGSGGGGGRDERARRAVSLVPVRVRGRHGVPRIPPRD